MNKGEIAKGYYSEGFNCAEAVAMSFEKEMGIDRKTIRKLIRGFGGGVGRQGLVCGAVSGMTMVLGYLADENATKVEVYALIKNACSEVAKEIGALNCAEIKAKSKVSCGDICRIVAEITDKYVNK